LDAPLALFSLFPKFIKSISIETIRWRDLGLKNRFAGVE